MNDRGDGRRRGFERDARRRFGRGRALAVAEEVITGLRQRFGIPTWEAWAATAELMGAHGQEPTGDELRRAMATINAARRSADAGQKQRAAGLLYCVLRALGRWRLREVGDGARVSCPAEVRDHIGDLSTDPREEEALARAVVAAVERLEKKGSHGQFTVADARTMHAVALLKLPEADAREAGRGLLEQQIEAMERLLAGELVRIDGSKASETLVEECRSLHAMAVNNLAQAWEQRVEGERADNLRRAIEVYERCCALPTRIAEPAKLLHSLHHLALCLRYLAREVGDLDERGALLGRALEVAEQGLALPGQHPWERFPMLEPLRLNWANTEARWIEWQEQSGATSPEVAERRRKQHSEATLAWLAGSPIREQAKGRGAAVFFAQGLGRAGKGVAEASAIEALHTLTGELLAAAQRNEQRFMTRDEAQVALSAMSALTPGGVPSPAVEPLLGCLGLVMGGLHPLHAGLAAARGLFAHEIVWLAPHLRRLGGLGRTYIEDAMKGIHRWMCEPDLPDAHRRLFAGQIARLAELALDPEVGLVGLEPLERVRLLDLTGAGFYRAESTFYGQGVSHEGAAAAESVWRISLYRARQVLDHCATLLTYDELRPLVADALRGSLDEVVSAMRRYQAYSTGGVEVREIREPREEMSRLRAEIQGYRRAGRARGWSPAVVETTPAPTRGEIEAWVREHPTTGLLLAGDAELALVGRARDGQVEAVQLAGLCGEAWSRMEERAAAFRDAWDRLLLGPPEESAGASQALAGALAEIVEDPGWRGFAESLARVLDERGLTTLALVERGRRRVFPWGNLPVGEATLADAVALVYLPTLAASGARPAPLRDGRFAYVGAAAGVSPELELGRASFGGGGDVVVGPLAREAFERGCIGAGVVRVFTHGAFNSVDAPQSGIVLDEAGEEQPYQGYEIEAMDLRGCGRVELWACESGVQLDLLGQLLGNDEPLGIASCFLLAGARVVIGSLWKQPAMVAGLLAAAFAAVAGPPGSAARDARALAGAVAAYRRVVEDGGLFEAAFCRALASSLRADEPGEQLVTRAVHAAWCAAATHLAGGGSIALPWSAVRGFERQDATLAGARAVADDPAALEVELRRVARRQLAPFRTRVAWSGWRVLARDRSAIA